MTDIFLEIIRALVLLGIVIFLSYSGRNRFEQSRKGWNFIISGFGLLLFGSILDISDNFENLNQFIFIGETEAEAFLEKFVGFLGGFVFLAIGLYKWIPGVQDLSDLVDIRTRDLQETNQLLLSEIAERKRAENVKNDFVSTVSHELRTPLTSIKGSLGLVRSGVVGELPDKLGSMLDIAYNNSDRLIRLINDILDIEKIAAGRIDCHMAPLELGEFLEQALQANKGYGKEHNVTFAVSIEVPEAKVCGDHDRLMQVMSNLISNAAKFSFEREQVEISLSRQDKGFRIAVTDHGSGIPGKFRDKVFEKFLQADSSDTRRKSGTGLGLYITKAIIEQHGGAIDFDTKVGKGTTFFFDLPEWPEKEPVAGKMAGTHL